MAWRGLGRVAGALAAAALGLGAAGPALAQAGTAAPARAGVGTVVVPAGTRHLGGIRLAVGTVVVRGREVGDIDVGVGEVEVGGNVTGSIRVGVGEVVLARAAHVLGGVSLGLGREVRLPAGQPLPPAQVPTTAPGRVVLIYPVSAAGWAWAARARAAVAALPHGLGFGAGAALAVLGRLAWWLVSLGVALAVLALFPEAVDRVAADAARAPLSALGWGALLALAAGPAALLLTITLVGIPLALLLGLALLAAKVMGYVAVSLLLGRRLLPHLGAEGAAAGWALAAGTALLLLVGSVPALGLAVDAAVALVGIGSSGRTGFGSGRPWFRAGPGAP
ncbi:MAG: hypothetical protein K6V73_08500 [Firmicutes bacterium]|nr:hypothetical protein [Bacillota bacterium]